MNAQANKSSADTRLKTAQWGHWGISFSEHTVTADGQHSYAPAVIHGHIYFPVGVCGPADMGKRSEYERAVSDWLERGILPKALVPSSDVGALK